jgi:hypothetical protein
VKRKKKMAKPSKRQISDGPKKEAVIAFVESDLRHKYWPRITIKDTATGTSIILYYAKECRRLSRMLDQTAKYMDWWFKSQ